MTETGRESERRNRWGKREIGEVENWRQMRGREEKSGQEKEKGRGRREQKEQQGPHSRQLR